MKTFHDSLKHAKCIEEVNRALKKALKQLGITMFTYTCYSLHPGSKKKIKYDSCSEGYLTWHQHYLTEGYDTIDSTHSTVHRNNLPIYWDLKQQLADAKTQKEKQMRLDSIEFGVEKGVSIPVHSGLESYANFLVAQNIGETCLEQWEKLQYELFTIAHYYHQYIQNFLLFDTQLLEDHCLSQREMQCLMLTAVQSSVEDIAKKLNISERTVNFHLQNINKKLGTRNKHQSVTLALDKGFLTL